MTRGLPRLNCEPPTVRTSAVGLSRKLFSCFKFQNAENLHVSAVLRQCQQSKAEPEADCAQASDIAGRQLESARVQASNFSFIRIFRQITFFLDFFVPKSPTIRRRMSSRPSTISWKTWAVSRTSRNKSSNFSNGARLPLENIRCPTRCFMRSKPSVSDLLKIELRFNVSINCDKFKETKSVQWDFFETKYFENSF